MHAAKVLFARLGYEQTSTATIAREAGSSESQLMRYFGGKAGLLEAIFNDSWAAVIARVSKEIPATTHAHDAILSMLSTTMEAFGGDHDIAVIFLFEGRRIRGNEVILSKGFLEFYQMVQAVIRRGQQDGSFRSDLNPLVLGAAFLGAAEGMMRDRLLAERQGLPNPFDDADVRKTFRAIIDGVAGR
jgi:AcrR family transcriptional regulator